MFWRGDIFLSTTTMLSWMVIIFWKVYFIIPRPQRDIDIFSAPTVTLSTKHERSRRRNESEWVFESHVISNCACADLLVMRTLCNINKIKYRGHLKNLSNTMNKKINNIFVTNKINEWIKIIIAHVFARILSYTRGFVSVSLFCFDYFIIEKKKTLDITRVRFLFGKYWSLKCMSC